MSDYVYHANALSASRIKTFNSCPKQYEFRYIQKKEATKAGKGYRQLGTLVHEAIENVMTAYPDLRDEHALSSRFKQEFYRLDEGDDVETTRVDSKQRTNGLDCLDVAARFIANYKDGLGGGEDFEVRELERFTDYYITVPGVQRWMVGFMDVCTKDEVWDWKTGRIRDDSHIDELIQGAAYMAGFHNEFGRMPSAIRFIYLKEEKQRELDPTQENWNRMLAYARKLVDADKTEEYPAMPEESKCYWCDYSNWCPESLTSPGQLQQAIDANPEYWDAV